MQEPGVQRKLGYRVDTMSYHTMRQTKKSKEREDAQERMALSCVRISSSHPEEKDRCSVGWWHKKTQRMETSVSHIQDFGKCVAQPDRFTEEIHIHILRTRPASVPFLICSLGLGWCRKAQRLVTWVLHIHDNRHDIRQQTTYNMTT